MTKELTETLWQLVTALEGNSECLDKQVACLIYNTSTDEVLGRGWNIHLDGVCDCDTTKTAQHAEQTCYNDLYLPVNRNNLVAYVSHKPCSNCENLLKEVCKTIEYIDQKTGKHGIINL